MMIRNKKLLRAIAVFFSLNILVETLFPLAAAALTSGPNSPEFGSFTPVTTTDMVNVFSGDFNYNLPVLNLPGPDGAGYALSLSYTSGVSSEEESSWVGYGWTLNPGAINRQTRGIPDDFNGETVTQYNKVRPNWSSSIKVDGSVEFFSVDKSGGEAKRAGSIGSLGLSKSVRFNNYQGFIKFSGYDLGVKGMATLSLNRSAGETTFGFSVNPGAILSELKKDTKKKSENSTEEQKDVKKVSNWTKMSSDEKPKFRAKLKRQTAGQTANRVASSLASTYAVSSFSEFGSPTNVSHYSGIQYNYSASLQVNAYLPVGIEGGYSGNFNIQINEPAADMKAYGYMYNPDLNTYLSNIVTVDGQDQSRVLADYMVEKGSSYNKRDHTLGMPFNNADNFMATGEGVTGGFRLYHDKVGHYYPNMAKSKQKIRQMALEFMVSDNIGIGFDFGIGKQTLEVEGWKDPGNTSNTDRQFDIGDKGFFRFGNDMGGKIDYTSNTDVLTGTIGASPSIIPGTKVHPVNAPAVALTAESGQSSSYIDPIYSGDKIDGFEVVNEAGMHYVYDHPVKTSNEKTFQIGIDNSQSPAPVIENKYLAYQEVFTDDPLENKVITGEERAIEYATSFLLTSITTPEYVDRGPAGPDPQDFGGWTKLSYRKSQSYEDNGLYHFRIPYRGLLYQQGALSSGDDDMGTVSMGDKETYYLKAIETKTHVAFFITNETDHDDFVDIIPDMTIRNSMDLAGSGIPRTDGLGAEPLNSGVDPAAEQGNHKDPGQKLERLEKIVVYAKKRLEKPLQTTRFEYDNSLCRNLPNVVDGTPYAESGKLVLKRVWFEYEGVIPSKIAPYEFDYNYFTQYPSSITQKYTDIYQTGNNVDISQLSVDPDQNPDYQPHALDMWGHYQHGGDMRHQELKPWVSQKEPHEDFDPAAWHLKRIILPSGGEIHVQFQQKDYCFVQDRHAMAMVSLASATDSYEPENTKFFLDLTDLGTITTAQQDQLEAKLREHFVENEEKIYFKFLYALKGQAAGLNNCRSEYITGYTSVNKVGQESGKIFLSLGDDKPSGLNVFKNNEDRKNIPKQVCYDLMANQRGGLVDNNDCVSPLKSRDDQIMDYYEAGIQDNKAYIVDNIERNSTKFKKDVVKPMLKNMKNHLSFSTPKKKDVCKKLDPGLSYLRIPIFVKAKKGGGVRVKRLLMYDPGIESGDANLYGSEYIYEEIDGRSSGVATNEPAAGREENPLVNILPRKKKSLAARVVSGRDKKQMEGPLGETLLPGASIGHSRVVIRNIHTGKTGSGFKVEEYFTAKDYPYDKYYVATGPAKTIAGKGVDYSAIKDQRKKDWIKLPLGPVNFSVNKLWTAQGFRFIINNMHGQAKKMASYGGEYGNFTDDFSTKDKTYYLSAATEYEYFEPGEKIKMLDFDPDAKKFRWIYDTPGMEEDITRDMRRVNDESLDMTLEIDASVTINFLPVVFVTFFPSFSYSQTSLSTHSTTKVLRYPAIVRSITQYQDGTINKTDHLAFNPATGQPVLTRTHDGFDNVPVEGNPAGHDGSYYAFHTMGSWMYPELGRKTQDVSYKNQLSVNVGSLTTYGANGNILDLFSGSPKEWDPYAAPMSTVVTASVNTFQDQWYSNLKDIDNNDVDINAVLSEYNISNTTELDRNWFSKGSYIYKTDISSANDPANRIYAGGVFDVFNFFDYSVKQQTDPNWLLTNEVLKYDPNGNALEERNILGIHSGARFGYAHTLPIAISQNATYESVQFEDFENHTNGSTDFAHSGLRSFNYKLDPTYAFIKAGQLKLTQQLSDKGAYIKVWVKHFSTIDPVLENETAAFSANINNVLSIPFEKVAGSGEWTLYRAVIDDWGPLALNDVLEVKLDYNIDYANGEEVYVDDFRFQPRDAQTTCYVYDKATLRLISQFDDHHFGMFYQYNNEGRLVRRLVETERGLKTLQENQYNVPLVEKNP